MARRFTCGCEEADVVSMWDVVDTYASEQQTGLPTFGWNDLVYWSPRTGRGMYVMNNQMMVRNLTPDNPTELYFGFAFRQKKLMNNDYSFYIYTDSPGVYSNFLGMWIDEFGTVQIRRTGTEIARSRVQVVRPDQWHYFEVYAKPRNTNGQVIVKVDGAIVIDFTGDTTNDLEVINGYQFQGLHHTDPYLSSYDDIVVNDTSGSVNNSWPGIVRLLPIRPKAAGNYAQWSRGGVDLGSDAAQLRNGSFNFAMLQTSGSGNKATFDAETPDIPTNAIIKNITMNVKARMTSGSGYISPMLRSNGVDSIGAAQTLVSGWKFFQKTWDKNPEDESSWIEADIANLEIGASS